MQGRLLGTLSFGSRSRPRFSSDEIAVMKAVTDPVAVAMHRIETQRALRRSEARYRALVTASAQIIYDLRHRKKINKQSSLEINPGIETTRRLGRRDQNM